ncbi:hypothetical protein BSKO_01282 [Bryopsis sp. KO-2023]|nr:hypothetical protein BSKO_01282 [Bryopsis sp. KO-2023]
MPLWSIAIHGGAGNISRDIDATPFRRELARALDRAVSVVKREEAGVLVKWSEKSTIALRAAVEAVVLMEDCPLFNAGKGSCLTTEGICEMEAAVMEGTDMDSGACCGVTTTVNPILLAELVRTRTDHTFLSNEPLEKMARDWGLKQEKHEFFVTEKRSAQSKRAKELSALARDHDLEDDAKGTVGAVARDSDGNLAVAVSTGGMTNKLPGRIGDSPSIGTGCFATPFAAVCGTGTGEAFANQASAAQVCFAMEYGGLSLQDAVLKVLHEKMDKEAGGIIAVDADGEIAMEISSTGMFRAAQDSNGNYEMSIWDEKESGQRPAS